MLARSFKYSITLPIIVLISNFSVVQNTYATINSAKNAKPATHNELDKVSYILGHQWGSSLKKDKIAINKDTLVKGLLAGINGEKSVYTDEESQATMKKFIAELQTKNAEVQKKVGEQNLKNGENFLAENKKKPGVISLPSGVQYKILKQGNGSKPNASNTVTVHYEGRLINGTVFDSSYKRGQSATFGLSSVIKGWTEILQHMPVGSLWEVYIPSKLAYDAKSPSPEIAPHSTLIFKIELLAIQDSQK
ncbi:MAG: FKBP-type peptidyl-prolyl cis-trans isomerase [Silvanigrellaceae bacterium]|nr:FKBP-type peptidyl-prolyl cis-trans isomerase [Silvanigrellaceae bacterium]